MKKLNTYIFSICLILFLLISFSTFTTHSFATVFIDESWRVPEVEHRGRPLFVDVNGDGQDDIFITTGSSWTFPDPFLATLFINDGSGIFTDESEERLPTEGIRSSHRIAKGDVDGDGDFDLYFTSGSSCSPRPDYLYINTLLSG